jgi:ribosome biogenesis protein UTP30
MTQARSLFFLLQKRRAHTTCLFFIYSAGNTAMSVEKLVENILAISENAVPKIPRQWANIQNVGIKTPDSVSLPIYNKTPESLMEIAKMAGLKSPKEQIDTPVKEAKEKKDEESKKVDAASKRKRDLKSPLVHALKKQKKEEEEAKGKESEKKKEKAEKKSKDEVTSAKVSPKAKKQNAKEVEEKAKTTPKQNEKRKPSEDLNTPKAKAGKKQKTPDGAEKQKTPEGKKQKTPEKAKTTPTKESSAEKKEFIAAKKFSGSKKGYVYRMSKQQGLGYHIDNKPVVDRMALDAISRLNKNSPRGAGGSGSKKNKSKGSRNF